MVQTLVGMYQGQTTLSNPNPCEVRKPDGSARGPALMTATKPTMKGLVIGMCHIRFETCYEKGFKELNAGF